MPDRRPDAGSAAPSRRARRTGRRVVGGAAPSREIVGPVAPAFILAARAPIEPDRARPAASRRRRARGRPSAGGPRGEGDDGPASDVRDLRGAGSGAGGGSATYTGWMNSAGSSASPGCTCGTGRRRGHGSRQALPSGAARHPGGLAPATAAPRDAQRGRRPSAVGLDRDGHGPLAHHPDRVGHLPRAAVRGALPGRARPRVGAAPRATPPCGAMRARAQWVSGALRAGGGPSRSTDTAAS